MECSQYPNTDKKTENAIQTLIELKKYNPMFYSKNPLESNKITKDIEHIETKLSKFTILQNKKLQRAQVLFTHKNKHLYTFDNTNPLKKLGFYILKCKQNK